MNYELLRIYLWQKKLWTFTKYHVTFSYLYKKIFYAQKRKTSCR